MCKCVYDKTAHIRHGATYHYGEGCLEWKEIEPDKPPRILYVDRLNLEIEKLKEVRK